MGSRGDSYDNALAETVINLFKTEVIHHQGPWRGLEDVEIATCARVGRTTVIDYLSRADAAGVGWPLDAGLSDAELEALLFPPAATAKRCREPDSSYIDAEMRRKHVSLILLREEYKAAMAEVYQYSQFCLLFRKWQ